MTDQTLSTSPRLQVNLAGLSKAITAAAQHPLPGLRS